MFWIIRFKQYIAALNAWQARQRWGRPMVSLFALTFLLAAAAPADAASLGALATFDAYCDLYTSIVQWIRTGAAILTVLAILYLGVQKLAASVLPDLGLRTGPIVLGIGIGLVLVAFGENIATGIIEAFGLTAVTC
jgi:hypothetical protein